MVIHGIYMFKFSVSKGYEKEGYKKEGGSRKSSGTLILCLTLIVKELKSVLSRVEW
jgi:hypothetical protein